VSEEGEGGGSVRRTIDLPDDSLRVLKEYTSASVAIPDPSGKVRLQWSPGLRNRRYKQRVEGRAS